MDFVNVAYEINKFLKNLKKEVSVSDAGLPCEAGPCGTERDYPAFKENLNK